MFCRPWANITLPDLFTEAPGQALDLDAVLERILAQAPARAVYVGWSLGGQLAAELARRAPERVVALVSVCSNPCFCSDGDWPGMEPATFAEFRARLGEEPEATLRRFDSLQASGSQRPRELMRQLRELPRRGSPPALLAGLDWLCDLDQRDLLTELAVPQCHLLGADDGLLGPDLVSRLRTLLPAAQISTLEGVSHVALLETPAEVARHLRGFLDGAGLLQAPGTDDDTITKSEVAASFSRAAPHYDSVATLQRDVGNALLAMVDAVGVARVGCVDLVWVTGYFSPALR